MNKAILYFSCLICVLLGSGPQPAARAFGQHSSDSKHATRAEVRALRTALEVLQTRHQLPGITASVVFPDGSQIHASAGYSDVEGRRPMNSSSRMLAGSVGKTFFAAFFMRLVAEGRLNLDQRIAYWLEGKPWFKRLPNAEEITFRMLLNHSSGLPEYVESPEFVDALWRNPDRIWTPEELLSYVLDKPAKFPAGHGWSYADTNYILAGYVAEQMTGESLYNQIRQSLLLPLGLLDTEPSVHRKLLHLATGYSMPSGPFHINGRTLTEGQLPFSPQFEWAGGGFVSDVRDLARWAKFLYEGEAFDRRLMPIMLEGVPAGTGPGDQYGLGVQIRHTDFGISYGHGGWYPGYLTEIEYFPRYRISIAVQVNTDEKDLIGSSVHAYAVDILGTLLRTLHMPPRCTPCRRIRCFRALRDNNERPCSRRTKA